MLLEDGELHGTGRQRQFRWKNIDSAMDEENSEAQTDENAEGYLEEDESEQQWRKMRYEREIFLRKVTKYNSFKYFLNSFKY